MANFYSKKVCRFCAEKSEEIDYKDVKLLQRYLNSYGKIESRKRTGTCLKHQRRVVVALKRARHLALLPFVVK
ncbi:MAG TPA: 30S ribosomal protein S18 [Candidatus Dormibacteraeota bacterium]|nr:30S ribosomal protein S18 [Candidatus Dormibacteraeota bacterium]